MLLTQSFDTCVWLYRRCCCLPKWKGVCTTFLGNVASSEAHKMPPTCSVKQANQNELEIMCRQQHEAGKIRSYCYVYNCVCTHWLAYITSHIRVCKWPHTYPYLSVCKLRCVCFDDVVVVVVVVYVVVVAVCLAGCVTILMKVQKLCNTNNMNKHEHRLMCVLGEDPRQCVPIQLNENCTCSCTNHTKRPILIWQMEIKTGQHGKTCIYNCTHTHIYGVYIYYVCVV